MLPGSVLKKYSVKITDSPGLSTLSAPATIVLRRVLPTGTAFCRLFTVRVIGPAIGCVVLFLTDTNCTNNCGKTICEKLDLDTAVIGVTS